MPPRLVDTNVLVRYLTRDDPEKSDRALALLQRVEDGHEEAALSPMVVFETAFTLAKTYRASRASIKAGLEAVISLRGVRLANKALYIEALGLYERSNVSFADAYNAAFMQSRGMTEIYTWDTDFDKFEGITRIAPGEG